MFYFAVIMLVLSMIVARNVAGARTGRGFYAIRENEKVAAIFGVGLTRYKLMAFALSGGIAALAGAVNVTYIGVAQSQQYPTELSLTLVALVLIGGIGSLSGSVFGAFLVFGLPRLVHFSNGWIVPIGTGVLLLLVIIRARGGVAGVVQALRTRMVESLDELSPPPAAPAAPAPG
jgi:branched-chain amino acid transport system permease protein